MYTPILRKTFKYVCIELTCIREAKTLIGSRCIAVELQPQVIGCAVEAMTQHPIKCEVAKETRRRVLPIIHLSIKPQEQGRKT